LNQDAKSETVMLISILV